jgi:hypothetical protein
LYNGAHELVRGSGLVPSFSWFLRSAVGRRTSDLGRRTRDTELRYDYTRLRSQVSRLDPDESTDEPPAPVPGQVAFVPLASMKKKKD